MLLKETSQDFKKLFLLKFTEELLKNSAPIDVYKLEKTLQEIPQPKPQKKQIKDILKERQKRELDLIKQNTPINKIYEKEYPTGISNNSKKRILRVSSARLPPTMEYLKPTTLEINIDLGRLNPLIKDPMVRDIECNGQDTKVIAKGPMGTKESTIILNKDEINYVIQKFSEISKTPIKEGFFKVTVGKMTLSAIISNITGSRFLIKKMTYNSTFK